MLLGQLLDHLPTLFIKILRHDHPDYTQLIPFFAPALDASGFDAELGVAAGARRNGEGDRTEIRGRDGKYGNPDHQENRHSGVMRTNNRPSERKDRQIGRDDADLRKHIETDHAVPGENENTIRNPERERRAKISAKPEFMADGDGGCDVSRRRPVEE